MLGKQQPPPFCPDGKSGQGAEEGDQVEGRGPPNHLAFERWGLEGYQSLEKAQESTPGPWARVQTPGDDV